MTVTQADETTAEEIVSAANVVTNHGYYEIDIDAVIKITAKHREDAARPLLERIEAFEAENARLRAALEVAWSEAQKMRNASKLVGPYSNDANASRIWSRSLYHAGKDLMDKLRPARQALGETE